MHELVRLLGSTPLVGRYLWAAGWKAHRAAATELIFVLVISTSPIWLGAGYQWQNQTGPNFLSLIEIVRRSLSRGELFFYSASILTTVLWIISRDFEYRRQRWPAFPYRTSLFIVGLVAWAISTFYFGVNFAAPLRESNRLFGISAYVFVLSFGIYYIATVINHAHYKPLQERSADDAATFSEQLKQHRSENVD